MAYCDRKESKRYGLPEGSIRTVTYADCSCRFFEEKK